MQVFPLVPLNGYKYMRIALESHCQLKYQYQNISGVPELQNSGHVKRIHHKDVSRPYFNLLMHALYCPRPLDLRIQNRLRT